MGVLQLTTQLLQLGNQVIQLVDGGNLRFGAECARDLLLTLRNGLCCSSRNLSQALLANSLDTLFDILHLALNGIFLINEQAQAREIFAGGNSQLF